MGGDGLTALQAQQHGKHAQPRPVPTGSSPALTSSPHTRAHKHERNRSGLTDPPGHGVPPQLRQPAASIPPAGGTGQPCGKGQAPALRRAPQEGRAKGRNRQPSPDSHLSRSAPPQPLCASRAGERREEEAHGTLRSELAPVCWQRQRPAFPRPPGHGVMLGTAQAARHRPRAEATGRYLRTLPPAALQQRQLPCGQQLSMSLGRRWEKPSTERGSAVRRCLRSVPQQAGWFLPQGPVPAQPAPAGTGLQASSPHQDTASGSGSAHSCPAALGTELRAPPPTRHAAPGLRHHTKAAGDHGPPVRQHLCVGTRLEEPKGHPASATAGPAVLLGQDEGSRVRPPALLS